MDCHMMVSQPEKVILHTASSFLILSFQFFLQWVDDIADAGGAMYCFHLEAASE